MKLSIASHEYYRRIRSECHCSFYFLSAQVCPATCYQLWCYLWAEHTFLPHHIYLEPWFWPNQRPFEISREVWIWRKVPVPCYGPRPREGKAWHMQLQLGSSELITGTQEVGIHYEWKLLHLPWLGGSALVGQGSLPWSLVNAAELSSVSEVAQGAGKVLRKDH